MDDGLEKMGFDQVRLELKRFGQMRSTVRDHLRRAFFHLVVAQLRIGESGVGQGETRIERDRLFEELDSRFEAVRTRGFEFAPRVLALEIAIVSLRIRSRHARQLFCILRRQLRLQFTGHGFGHFALDLEHFL